LASLFKDNKPPTIARKISAIRALYRFLVRRGFVRDNPATSLRSPKYHKPLPQFVSVDDAFDLMEAPESVPAYRQALQLRDRAMLELLYGSGLRVSELVGLNLADLHMDEGMARVRGKGNKERLVPLGAKCVEALEAYFPARLQCRRPATGLQHPDALLLARYGARITAPGTKPGAQVWGVWIRSRRPSSSRTEAFVRDPFVRRGRGPARYPRAARSRQFGHHSALYPRECGQTHGGI
jgi:site-specific recombinase XerD